jgi:hypothetical protein
VEHEEFVARSSASALVWGVSGAVAGSVRAVWGAGGLALYLLALLAAAAPLLGFAAWSALWAWLVPGALAFIAARPGLNLIDGLAWLGCGLIGAVVAVWAGPLHLFAGAAVVATWILAGAVRGTTMAALESRLRASKDDYERLRAAGKLILIPRPPSSG